MGKLCVLEGMIEYVNAEDPANPINLRHGEHVVIEPKKYHYVRPDRDARFFVEFYRETGVLESGTPDS